MQAPEKLITLKTYMKNLVENYLKINNFICQQQLLENIIKTDSINKQNIF